jgi:predicted enzyme related to lactoylglutathione lyase
MPTTVGQYCIYVSDLERSVRFYEDIIGLKVQSRTEIPDVHEAVLAADEGGGRLQLAERYEGGQPIDHGFALWKIYMNVDDCVATHQKAVDAGYTSTMTPERLDRWPVIVGFILDPDGYSIELIQRVDE